MHNKLIVHKGEYYFDKEYSEKIISVKLIIYYSQEKYRIVWQTPNTSKEIRQDVRKNLHNFAQNLISDKSNQNFYNNYFKNTK